jgi:hypothetical protein
MAASRLAKTGKRRGEAGGMGRNGVQDGAWYANP